MILTLSLGGLWSFGQQNQITICNGISPIDGVKFTVDVIEYCGARPVTLGPFYLTSYNCINISPVFSNPSAMWIGINASYTNNGGASYYGSQYSPNSFIPSSCWTNTPSNTTGNTTSWQGIWNSPVVEFH